MCDIMSALAIGSTIVGVAGAKQQSDASSEAQLFNARVQEQNAELSERRARDALERGKDEEQQKRQENSQILGRQTAAMAANGVDIGFGSALDVLLSTTTLGEMDALRIRKNSADEAFDFRVDAANGRANASLSRANAKNTSIAGNLAAFGTILSGAGKAYKTAYDSGSLAFMGR